MLQFVESCHWEQTIASFWASMFCKVVLQSFVVLGMERKSGNVPHVKQVICTTL